MRELNPVDGLSMTRDFSKISSLGGSYIVLQRSVLLKLIAKLLTCVGNTA